MARRRNRHNTELIEVPHEHAEVALNRVRPVIDACLEHSYFFEEAVRSAILSIYQQGLLDGVSLCTKHPEKLGIPPQPIWGP